ncbi:MAG: UbiD family decarboxylase [Candidatus Hydrothermarchaeales archaeon]
MDLRDFIETDLTVEEEISADYEISKKLFENPDKTVLFENVYGSDFRVVGNLCPSRNRLYQSLGTSKKDYINHVLNAVENPIDPVVVDSGECQEVVLDTDLTKIPILTHFRGDSGRYITSGIVIANDEESGRNVSIHRMMVLDKTRLAARLVERHLWKYHQRAEARNEALEVAIAVGVHPAIFFASAYSVPEGYDEFKLASSLLGKPMELVDCENVDLQVPRYAEIVMEGRILPNERADEGPFVDITKTYDIIRKEPVIEISRITHRKDPIYQALMPSCNEHKIFMGMPREPSIFNSVKSVADVKNACLTDGGCNWLHGVVSIKKTRDTDVKEVIMAAFDGHHSMKHLIIVDDDIDIFDPQDVEYALATRFQGDEDTTMIKNVKGSSLDPSADDGAMTTKVGLDATKSLDNPDSFKRIGLDKQ